MATTIEDCKGAYLTLRSIKYALSNGLAPNATDYDPQHLLLLQAGNQIRVKGGSITLTPSRF